MGEEIKLQKRSVEKSKRTLEREKNYIENKQKKRDALYQQVLNANQAKIECQNRIDEIIVFNPLNNTVIKEVANKFLNQLKNRLKESDVELSISDKAMDKIIELGFDETYGARPMKRHIQRAIESLVAKYLLENYDAKNIIVDLDSKHNYYVKTK